MKIARHHIVYKYDDVVVFSCSDNVVNQQSPTKSTPPPQGFHYFDIKLPEWVSDIDVAY